MRVLRRTTAALPALTLLGVLGCEQGTIVELATVSDSAGITIVKSQGGIWDQGQSWVASASPLLNIGVIEGAPEYQLFEVRNAIRLSNGNIIVAASNELRFYDENGSYLSTSGREGEGPGEFQQLGWVRSYAGDSIAAYDYGQFRVSVLDEDGVFGRSFRIEPEGEFGFVMGEGVFTDGTVLVKAPLLFRDGFTDGAVKNDEDYHLYSSEGEFVDSIATLPGPDQYIRTGSEGDNRFVTVTTPPFGRESSLAIHGMQFYFGSAGSYEIERRTKYGVVDMLIRKEHPPRPISAGDLEMFVDQALADVSDESARRQRREGYEEMPVPESMPAYADLEVDELGNLWVREYEPDEAAASLWTVFDPEGQMLGSVSLAPAFEVNQIGDDFVLGIWRDEFDVEHVHLYGLIKPESESGPE